MAFLSRNLLTAALLVAAASPAQAAWARFKVADFPTNARHPAIVEFDDGPALVLLESEDLHVLRKSTSGWRQETLTPDSGMKIYGFTAGDCRGDGVKRLYVTFRSTPRIWEISPYGSHWSINEFSTHGERPSEHANSGPLACGSSADGRPSLFITHPDRKHIRECRWKKRWTCAAIVRDENIQGPMQYLHTDPPAWETPDLLFFQPAIAARGPDGWKIAPNIDTNSYPDVVLSRNKPRTFYSFGQNNLEISLDRALGVVDRKEMAKLMAGETVAVLRSEASERIYGTSGEDVVEYREEGGLWSRSVIASFKGMQTFQVRAGDTRGDEMDRLYVLETAWRTLLPSRLWELVYYPAEDALEVPDPASDEIPAEGRKLLGDLLRAELGGHGGLTVLPGDGAAPAPSYRLISSVAAVGESREFKMSLVRADGSLVKELRASTTRAELPAAALQLALKVAEDWPLWTVP